MKEKIKEIMIFLKYFVTKPFREIGNLFSILRSPDAWIFVFFIIFLLKYLIGQGGLFDKLIIGSMLVVVVWKEYKCGEWKHQWRKKKEEEMREKLKKAKKR